MTDKELTARLRDFEKVTVGDAREAADRIEQLAVTNEQLVATNEALRYQRADLIAALAEIKEGNQDGK